MIQTLPKYIYLKGFIQVDIKTICSTFEVDLSRVTSCVTKEMIYLTLSDMIKYILDNLDDLAHMNNTDGH